MQGNRRELPWWNADGIDREGDDIPELTAEMLTDANFYDGRKLAAKRRRGRPISSEQAADGLTDHGAAQSS